MQSLEASTDEEFLESFAGIAAALIFFCKNTELDVYIRIAEALKRTDDPDPNVGTGCTTTDGDKAAYARTAELREPLSEAEIKTTTELVRGSKAVEVPSAYDPEKPDFVLEPVTLPEPRLLRDYTTAPCKHDCGIIK